MASGTICTKSMKSYTKQRLQREENMTAIEVKNISKKYKDKFAVKDITFSIKKGELFSLLGTNGAGKTTAIKMLSTLILPTSGSARVEGFDIIDDRMRIKEIINVSPQETAIAQNLTVKENLYFMAGVYNIPNKEEKISAIISDFGLSEVLNQKAKTLSGGCKRKLSIAISLINEPAVLFLDEPTLGLDVIARKELWRVINSLKGRVTVILTTHYMEEAESLSDTVAVMDKGKLIALGTPDELKKQTGQDRFEDAFTQLVMGGEDK